MVDVFRPPRRGSRVIVFSFTLPIDLVAPNPHYCDALNSARPITLQKRVALSGQGRARSFACRRGAAARQPLFSLRLTFRSAYSRR